MAGKVTEYRYKIEPRTAEFGGGWRLRLFENGDEVGGGVFPLVYYGDYTDDETALQFAHDDAQNEGEAWLASRPSVA